MKTLYIVTGPPGAGKTTYARVEYPDLPVFDRDLGNKDAWRVCKADCILITSAPKASQKTYWVEQGLNAGFTPKLLALIPSRMVAYARMKDRDGLSPSTRNDLEKSIEFWYANYSRHRAETRIHPS